jgi:hypothetical protein
MKKVLVISLVSFTISLLPSLCEAQFNTYHPFPDSNALWNETAGDGSCGTGVDTREYAYLLDGDTTVNALTYHKVYQIWGYWSNSCSTYFQTWLYSRSFYGGYRTDTMKHVYACCTQYLGAHDSLLYDFNLNVGDTLTQYTAHTFLSPPPYIVHSIDSVLVGSSYRKRFNIEINGDTMPWQAPSIVEGIGSTQGLFDFLEIPFEIATSLDCFTQNDTTWKPPYGNQNAYCGMYYAGINNLKAPASAISVFPNPGSGKFTIQSSVVSDQWSVEIYNVLGEQIYTSKFTANNSEFSIDLSSNPSGVYFYRVMAENRNLIGEGKVIVQK